MGGYAISRFLTAVFKEGGISAFLIVVSVLAVLGLGYWTGKWFVMLMQAKIEESKEVRKNLEAQNNMLIGELKHMTGEVMKTNNMHASALVAYTTDTKKHQALNIEAQRAIQGSCAEITVTQRQIATDFSLMKGWIQAQG